MGPADGRLACGGPKMAAGGAPASAKSASWKRKPLGAHLLLVAQCLLAAAVPLAAGQPTTTMTTATMTTSDSLASQSARAGREHAGANRTMAPVARPAPVVVGSQLGSQAPPWDYEASGEEQELEGLGLGLAEAGAGLDSTAALVGADQSSAGPGQGGRSSYNWSRGQQTGGRELSLFTELLSHIDKQWKFAEVVLIIVISAILNLITIVGNIMVLISFKMDRS